MAAPETAKRVRERVVLALMAGVIVAASVGAYAVHVRDRAARAAAEKAAEGASKKAKLEELVCTLDTQAAALRAAQDDARRATNATDRAAAHARAGAADADMMRTAASINELGGSAAAGSHLPTRTHCVCDAGDPFCSML